ncbi:hypothetical protein AX16_008996 [Volvariella volvacea WC 439]|nr:hypothetical protein AX16_008996 [Volvariella volvacea WC 439]
MKDLPLEVWCKVAPYIREDTRMFSHLRLTSRYFNAIFTPFSVQSFGVRITRDLLKCLTHHEQGERMNEYKPVPGIFAPYIITLIVVFDVRSKIGAELLGSDFWQDLVRFTGLKRLELRCKHKVDVEPVLHKILVGATAGELSTLSSLIATLPNSVLGLRKLERVNYEHDRSLNDQLCLASRIQRSQLQPLLKNSKHLWDFQIAFNCNQVTVPLTFRDIFPHPC